MARKKRVWRLNMCHHIMLRGIDGMMIFTDSRDRTRFYLLLQEATELHSLRVHAFCLMTNHIHLILEPIREHLATGVHRFVSRYAQYFNRRYKRRGYVFQGRFRSILVEDGVYLKRLTRYIHLNPLEAGLANRPDEYPWSSHNAYFGRDNYTWLETDRVLSRFGSIRSEALDNLGDYMSAKADAIEDAEEIRKASQIGCYGSEEFTNIYAPDAVKNQLSGEQKVSIEQLVERLCKKLRVSHEQLCSAERSQFLVDARAVLARSSQQLEGLCLGSVSRVLKKNPGTVSRLASRATKSARLNAYVDDIVKSFL